MGLLGPFAFGNILENTGELPRYRTKGSHFEVLSEFGVIVLKLNRFAGEGHPAIGLDPVALGAGHDLPHGPAHHIPGLHAGHAFKGRIHRQETIVDRSTCRIKDDLVQRESVEHLAKKGRVFLLDPFAAGDVGMHQYIPGLVSAGARQRENGHLKPDGPVRQLRAQLGGVVPELRKIDHLAVADVFPQPSQALLPDQGIFKH